MIELTSLGQIHVALIHAPCYIHALLTHILKLQSEDLSRAHPLDSGQAKYEALTKWKHPHRSLDIYPDNTRFSPVGLAGLGVDNPSVGSMFTAPSPMASLKTARSCHGR